MRGHRAADAEAATDADDDSTGGGDAPAKSCSGQLPRPPPPAPPPPPAVPPGACADSCQIFDGALLDNGSCDDGGDGEP